jgi:hypothetical protein
LSEQAQRYGMARKALRMAVEADDGLTLMREAPDETGRHRTFYGRFPEGSEIKLPGEEAAVEERRLDEGLLLR